MEPPVHPLDMIPDKSQVETIICSNANMVWSLGAALYAGLYVPDYGLTPYLDYMNRLGRKVTTFLLCDELQKDQDNVIVYGSEIWWAPQNVFNRMVNGRKIVIVKADWFRKHEIKDLSYIYYDEPNMIPCGNRDIARGIAL